MKLSPNFSLDELTHSEIAVRRGIDNTPDADVRQNLGMLADGLQRVRSVLGHPMRISSGYRSPAVNAAVGGSATSAHMRGLAADFTCPGFGSPRDVVMAIVNYAETINFDKVILEFGKWVHIQFRDQPRRQVLTAKHGTNGPIYVAGVLYEIEIRT